MQHDHILPLYSFFYVFFASEDNLFQNIFELTTTGDWYGVAAVNRLFGCLSGPPGFTCWISFAPVFSLIYC